MFSKYEKSFQETESVFAFAVVLLNVSILATTFSIGWLAYWFIKQSIQLESLLRVVQTN